MRRCRFRRTGSITNIALFPSNKWYWLWRQRKPGAQRTSAHVSMQSRSVLAVSSVCWGGRERARLRCFRPLPALVVSARLRRPLCQHRVGRVPFLFCFYERQDNDNGRLVHGQLTGKNSFESDCYVRQGRILHKCWHATNT